jgi:hypothetical protein
MAAILGSAFWDDRTAFRRAGAFLELFGLLQVAHELRNAGVLFKRAPVRTRLKSWLAQVLGPTRPQQFRIDASGGSFSLNGASVRLILSGRAHAMEDRIARLESNVSALRDRLDAEVERLQQDAANVRAELEAERQARATEIRRIDTQLQHFAVGGQDMAWVGFGWLVMATALTGFID